MTGASRFRYKFYKRVFFIFLNIAIIFLFGCSKDILIKAFNGELDYIEENKVITEYCQGCHTHNVFDKNEHIITVSKLYIQEKYLRAKECHLCHSIKTDMWGYTTHSTIYPSEEKNHGLAK